MKYLILCFSCILLGLTILNPTLAQESGPVKRCVIPATDEHGEINFGIVAYRPEWNLALLAVSGRNI